MAKLDLDLTAFYLEHARTKINKLALKLKKSPQRVKYTLKLLNKEILVHPHCIFDYSYFGLILFRVYFKGGYISEQDKLKILEQLRENQYIVSMYELSGEFDLVIELIAPNPSRVNKELKNLSELIPTLKHYKLILNIVTHLYPKTYLFQHPEHFPELEKQLIIGGDRSPLAFTNHELLIMKSLLEAPKIRLTALASRSGMNIKTAALILKSLQSRRIIKGFKYTINRDKLDVEKVRLFLNIHNTSKEREEELMDFFLNTKEAIQVNKTVGDWDMEVDLESLDKTRIKLIINQLRERFKDLIENLKREEFDEYYKKSYLPKHVFNPDLKSLLV